MLLIEKFGGLVVDHWVRVLIPNRAYTTVAEAAYKVIFTDFSGGTSQVCSRRERHEAW